MIDRQFIILFSSFWTIDPELISNGSLFQPHLRYTLTFFKTYTSRSRSFIITLSLKRTLFLFSHVAVWGCFLLNQRELFIQCLENAYCHVHKLLFAWLTDNSSYCFLASELSIEEKIKYSRQAAYSQSMGFAINISHAQ
jgi:hypothetical protein